jgi:hypothetical protein
MLHIIHLLKELQRQGISNHQHAARPCSVFVWTRAWRYQQGALNPHTFNGRSKLKACGTKIVIGHLLVIGDTESVASCRTQVAGDLIQDWVSLEIENACRLPGASP